MCSSKRIAWSNKVEKLSIPACGSLHGCDISNFTLLKIWSIFPQCLGNHEFDDGPAVLLTYLQNIIFPMLTSNLNASREPFLDGLYQPSLLLTVGGEDIAVVGYLTQETRKLVHPGISHLQNWINFGLDSEEVAHLNETCLKRFLKI